MAGHILRDQENDILDSLEDIAKEIRLLSSKKGKVDKTQTIRSCNQLISRTKNLIDGFQQEIRVLSQQQQNGYSARVNEWRDELRKRQTELDWKRNELQSEREIQQQKENEKRKKKLLSSGQADSTENELDQVRLSLGPDADTMMDRTSERDGGQGIGQSQTQITRAIALGDTLQDKTEASLKRTLRMAAEAETIGAKALQTMHSQEERMGRMHEDMDEIESDLKRAKQVIGQLAKGAASDRCVQILCAFITLSLILVIILAMVGADGGNFNVPDEVREGNNKRLRT